MNAKFRNGALAAFCVAAVLVLSPSRTQAAATFSIESSFTDLVGNSGWLGVGLNWGVESVLIDELSLEVGESGVFTYGVFTTQDFPISVVDALDNDDSFTANLLIDPPMSSVSGIGHPDGRLEWVGLLQLGNGYMDVVFDDSPINVVFDRGSYTVEFLSLYDLQSNGAYDLEAKITLTSYVPEPASMLVWTFLGLAVCGGLCWSRRKRG